MAGKKDEYHDLNIYQKLAKIRKNIEVIQKDSAGYGYKYVSEAEILSKLSIWLDKTGLLLIPKICQDTTTTYMEELDSIKYDKKTGDYINEKKNEVIVHGEMTFTWINIDNPEERLEIPWFFAGQQADASQAFGSGLTYCTRYFLLKFFNIATTEDDPDNWRGKQKAAEKEEDKIIAAEITKAIDELAKKYVSESKDPDKAKAELGNVVKKYVKSGNYFKIEDSVLAGRLLEDVKKLTETSKEAK